MNSKSKTKTQEQSQATVTNAPSAAYSPYINEGAAALKNGYGAAQRNIETIQPRLNQGMDYYGDVLGGKYLRDGNPYLEDVIGDSNRSISNSVNSEFSSAGRYGSGAHTGVLTDRLAANENNVRYGNYAAERGYQASAASGINGMALTSAALPQMASSEYARMLQALIGRYGTSESSGSGTSNSQTTSSKSPFELALAAAASAAAASDRRLKTNIKKVGTLDDGLEVYTYRYKSGGPVIMGVMADEVAELRPHALGPTDENGFGSVYYGRL